MPPMLQDYLLSWCWGIPEGYGSNWLVLNHKTWTPNRRIHAEYSTISATGARHLAVQFVKLTFVRWQQHSFTIIHRCVMFGIAGLQVNLSGHTCMQKIKTPFCDLPIFHGYVITTHAPSPTFSQSLVMACLLRALGSKVKLFLPCRAQLLDLGPSHRPHSRQLLSLTSPCCSGWPAPTRRKMGV